MTRDQMIMVAFLFCVLLVPLVLGIMIVCEAVERWWRRR